MPTYDFECNKCGYTTSDIKSIHFPKKSKCPKCNTKDSLIRLIGGGGGFNLKGDGFYCNRQDECRGK